MTNVTTRFNTCIPENSHLKERTSFHSSINLSESEETHLQCNAAKNTIGCFR